MQIQLEEENEGDSEAEFRHVVVCPTDPMYCGLKTRLVPYEQLVSLFQALLLLVMLASYTAASLFATS